MPTYVYKCDKCEEIIEIIQKMSETPLVKCPECDTGMLKRIIQGSNFKLKGKGWYKDGY